MNTINLVGRLCRDPEQNANATVTKYSIAVNRSFKREGEPEADFFNVVAFGKSQDFVLKYLKKGMMVGIEGRVACGSYTDKDTGKKIPTFDVIVSNHTFCEKAGNGAAAAAQDQEDGDLPF